MIGVDALSSIIGVELKPTALDSIQQNLGNVPDRWQSSVVLFQNIVGVRVKGNDIFRVGLENRLGVVCLEILEQHLFAEAFYLVTSIFFLFSQYAEINAEMMHQAGRSLGYLDDSVIVGAHAVNKKERLGGFSATE